jgi:NAD(P)-dependent dehydrogenase (short-subunit alcohol dehydrogenase family)
MDDVSGKHAVVTGGGTGVGAATGQAISVSGGET